MRIAVISDIHGNLEALDAVLAAARGAGAQRVLCLGDVVGYGPDPHRCVRLVRDEAAGWALGNHDLAVLPESVGLRGWFRADARIALDWTQGHLDETDLSYLRGLPVNVAGPWGLACHGSVNDPLTYVLTSAQAHAALLAADRRGSLLSGVGDCICLLWVGHTHVPMVVHVPPQGAHPEGEPRVPRWDYGTPLALSAGRWLVNPGSVGQPRDVDPRARWALFDSDLLQVTLHAVDYAYRVTQEKMMAVPLPLGLVMTLGPWPDAS
jgi:predicted phosphodiesterase